MTSPLSLNFSENFSYFIYPSKEIEGHGNHIKTISDFKKKLQYYNDRICTLSYAYFGEGLHCYGEYDHSHGEGEIILKKGGDLKSDADFDVYLEIRQQEIDRIQHLLSLKSNYAAKLKCFIEDKAGQHRYDELNIRNNAYTKFLANGGGTVPQELLGNNDVVDLNPRNSEERKCYNEYLLRYVEKLIENSAQFHRLIEHTYPGFLCSSAMIDFLDQLPKALIRNATIESEIKRIESKFSVGFVRDYIDILYSSSNANFADWQSALFTGFINGKDYDFGYKKLTVTEIKAFMHVKQIFDYYKKLPSLKMPIKRQTKYINKEFSKPQNSLQFISENRIERFLTIEGKIADKIERWRQGLDKIQCAAFCEILFELKYFKAEATRIVTVNMFASQRYGIEITNQLLASNKEHRKIHKQRIKRFFGV